jgi:hypothetical protein
MRPLCSRPFSARTAAIGEPLSVEGAVVKRTKSEGADNWLS